MVVMVAAFLTEKALVERVCKAAINRQIGKHINGKGWLPAEDMRTDSEDYHVFETHGLVWLATLCHRHSSTNLFKYHTKAGRGLQLLLDWLDPHAYGKCNLYVFVFTLCL